MRYWLNPKVESEEELEEKTKEICGIYGKAKELAKKGIKLYSTDECTGIQAKERLNKDKPLKCGTPRRVEYEYIRHGTVCLTANFEVGTGKVETSTINETRTETDFAGHIKKTVAENAKARAWWFIVDQLNTHKSDAFGQISRRKRRNRGNGVRRKRKKRDFAFNENKARVLGKRRTSNQIYIYAQALFVAQSSRDLVFDIVKKVDKMGQFQVKRRFARAIREVYQVF